MSPEIGTPAEARRYFPRVSGDEPYPGLDIRPIRRFSPRERG